MTLPIHEIATGLNSQVWTEFEGSLRSLASLGIDQSQVYSVRLSRVLCHIVTRPDLEDSVSLRQVKQPCSVYFYNSMMN